LAAIGRLNQLPSHRMGGSKHATNVILTSIMWKSKGL
jgi:hypothetical protein